MNDALPEVTNNFDLNDPWRQALIHDRVLRNKIIEDVMILCQQEAEKIGISLDDYDEHEKPRTRLGRDFDEFVLKAINKQIQKSDINEKIPGILERDIVVGRLLRVLKAAKFQQIGMAMYRADKPDFII